MKILELRSENVKRIVALTIHPGEEPIVTISGENGAGKSSALDSIVYALGGKDCNPPEVIRRGEKNATVEIDLGDAVVDYTVKCRWTPGGRVLSVESKDGAKFPSPQAFVEKLYGSLSFDPLAFIRLPAKEQADTVRKLVGVDTSAIEAEHKALYELRTAVTAKGKELAAQHKALPEPAAGTPDEPVSVVELMKEQAKLQEEKEANNRSRTKLINMRITKETIAARVTTCDELVTRLEKELGEANDSMQAVMSSLTEAEHEIADFEQEVSHLVDPDMGQLYERIHSIEATNAAVAAKKSRGALWTQLEAKREEKIALDNKLEALDSAKAKLIAGAKFPVPGMSFSTEGLTLNDLPLEQASSAEQLRVGMAMGLALNPKLRVVLIRDGSLLDNKSLAMVAQMAEEAKAQVWMERVTTGKIGFEIVEGFVASRDGVPVERQVVGGVDGSTYTLTVPDEKPGLSLVPPPPPSSPPKEEAPKVFEPLKQSANPTFKKRLIADLSGEELTAAIAEVEKSIAGAPLSPKSTASRAKLEDLKHEMSMRLDAAIDGPPEPGSAG